MDFEKLKWDKETVENNKINDNSFKSKDAFLNVEVISLIFTRFFLQESLSTAEQDFRQLADLDRRIKEFGVGPNPYTWFTMEALEDTWRNLQKIIRERDNELKRESTRQERNDQLRGEFAQHANSFYQWLTETRTSMMETSGSLEGQLEQIRVSSKKN